MKDDITLSRLQVPLEKIFDNYSAPPPKLTLVEKIFAKFTGPTAELDLLNELRALAKETGLSLVVITRAYKVVRTLRARRKS